MSEKLLEFYDNSSDPPRRSSTPVRLLLNAAHLYKLRVREHPIQELLALIGLAAGVALLFAVQVASTSVTGSVRQIAHGITGEASIEVVARESRGVDQRLVDEAQQLPAIRTAAPVVLQQIAVVGPAGRAPLTLVGVDERLERIGGEFVRKFSAKRPDINALGLFLTAGTARAIGVGSGDQLVIESGANKRETILGGTLSFADVGGLVKSPVALAPLGVAQRLSGMSQRISRVLILPKPGREQQATDELRALVGDKLDVRASDTEVNLLAQALKPDQRSSALFSAIAVVIGMLFAYNAILLSMVFRRRFIGYLRLIGADRPMVVTSLIFDAIVLGLAASLIGILAGDVLSREVFNSFPRYLSAGFPIGDQRVIDPQTIALSITGGFAAAAMALAIPAIDLFRMDAGSALGQGGSGVRPPGAYRRSVRLWLGLILTIAISVLVYIWPALEPVGLAVVIVAMALVIGPVIGALLGAAHRITRVRGGIGLSVAIEELVGSPGRTTALALIAAGATFGTLTVGGARLDVERGTKQLNHAIFRGADLWVLSGGQENAFMTRRFDPQPVAARLRKETDIRSLGTLHGTFADVDQRRVLVAAHPANGPTVIASKIVKGDAELAAQRIRAGGWIALYDVIAREHNLGPGDGYSLPTPTGTKRYRIAATVSNYGWPSGVIVMNNREFSRAWGDGQASALAVDLSPGTSTAQGKREIEDTLGRASALSVKTPAEAVNSRVATVTQGMGRLRQISALVLFAAVLAIVAAMFAAVWQRRERIASLRAIGMYRGEVYRALFAETTIVVFLGAISGVGIGLYAQFFASRWIEYSSGFHAPFRPAVAFGFLTFVQVVALSAFATAGPAYLAARVTPRVDQSI